MMTNEGNLALATSPYDSVTEWEKDCLAAALDDVIVAAGGPAV